MTTPLVEALDLVAQRARLRQRGEAMTQRLRVLWPTLSPGEQRLVQLAAIGADAAYGGVS